MAILFSYESVYPFKLCILSLSLSLVVIEIFVIMIAYILNVI